MRLKAARIREYKCISDSELFTLGPVTCLVGKNESGKTAVLQALEKLKAVDSAKSDFVDLEYPRRRWQPNMDASKLRNDSLETLWELGAEEVGELEQLFGEGCVRSNEVAITKGYLNEALWRIDYDEAVVVARVLANANLSAPEGNKIRNLKSVKEIIQTLKGLESPSENQKALLTDLTKHFKGESTGTAMEDVLDRYVPHVLYFSEYYTLPGQVSLDALKKRKTQKILDDQDHVFQALLGLAGTDEDSISDIATFERLRASLEAVSNRLSEEIFEYWSQNAHLEVVFSFDHARPEDPVPFNTGYVFRTSIRNTRHKSTVSFDERSSGFVWFFSFLVWFSQVRERYGDRLIILLDEPALNLHARAQADLLRYIRERLEPHYQVVYTTHSPFMVDSNNLEWTRTVEDITRMNDAGRPELLGTKVSSDILSVDKDTISPLQGALGYDITQTLFVGKHTLLVEGPSDLLYLKWMSRLLMSEGRASLDTRWVICPVGGLDKVGSFAALFAANALNVAVFTDFHTGDKRKVRSLQESNLLKAGHVFTADMYTDTEEADTEDVLGRGNYVALVNEAYGLEGAHAVSETPTDDAPCRVVEEVEKHFAVLPPEFPTFDHFTPAAYALENAGAMERIMGELPAALERFERFFVDVNKLLPQR